MPDRQLLTLPDARSLAWVEYGDPAGAVVLNHHGGLLSATDVAPLDEAARQAGVRLISFDRPGIGGSSPLPGRTVLDGARDVDALLEALGIGEVGLLGWSMGGQYALASAYHLGPRVRRTAVVAGCLPLDDAVVLSELNAMDQRFTSMAADHRRRLEVVASSWGDLARFAPGTWARVSAAGEPEIDVEAVRASSTQLATAAHESTAQRDGWTEEYRAWVRPWGFALGDIASEVDVWHGTEDHLVPLAWAQRMAGGLPSATLNVLEGEGHFLLLNHAPDVLAAICTTEVVPG